jgi:hypothetical protein
LGELFFLLQQQQQPESPVLLLSLSLLIDYLGEDFGAETGPFFCLTES